MNQNFKLYSQYYDLLYKDKDYQAETDYLQELISRFEPSGKSILELGSGTGKHANLLAQKGYTVIGLERSAEMVAIANQGKKDKVRFEIADITNFDLKQSFDIALSLFHVIGYLTDNKSLVSTFEHVHQHLNNNGLFIFDVWHSSAVHFQVPEKRTKLLENKQIKVKREASPIIYPELNIVEVNYHVTISYLNTGAVQSFKEKHPMRHFSKPEIELLAYATGFEMIHTEEFLTKATPSVHSWGVCYVLRKL
jgi:SAM-dependent methyltransferase